MDRFGVPTAPEGCGNDPHEGACFACSVHALRRGGARYGRVGLGIARQLFPLKYTTSYTTGGSAADGETPAPSYANFDVWRMWFGRVFAHERVTHEIARGSAATSR